MDWNRLLKSGVCAIYRGVFRRRAAEADHLALGREGEKLAERFLVRLGMKVLEKNFRTRRGEVDLICLDRGTVVFVEVKTRRSDVFAPPEEAVGAHKQRRLALAAMAYLNDRKWEDRPARFDVLAVVLDGGTPKIEHLPDAFELAVH
jgi:putative endonuclease